jgi:anti-sigma-K factor RskA
MSDVRRFDDIEELLGAYALDAVDDDERRQVEAYLETSPRAQAEVDQHREVAALLAFGGAPAPTGLWDRIAGALEEGAPEPGPELAKVLPVRARRRRWWVGALAAAAVVAIAVLSVALVRSNQSQTQSEAIAAAYHDAKGDPASKTVQLKAPDGRTATAVVPPSGSAYLDGTTLPALPADRIYQLWAVPQNGAPVSLGLLGSRPGISMFGLTGTPSALAISVETPGGAVAPTPPVQIVGALS